MAFPTDSDSADHEPSSSTSLSLLDRARQREDAAWERLIELYGPLLFRWCRNWGLNPSDAADIGQQVCLSLMQSLSDFEHRGTRGAFRSWLKTMTRHKAIDLWRSQARFPGTLPDNLAAPAAADEDAEAASDEARELYRRAADLIRVDFSETTWKAFWMTVVEERSVADVAHELQVSPNAVYIARSRVLTRLRTEFSGLLD